MSSAAKPQPSPPPAPSLSRRYFTRADDVEQVEDPDGLEPRARRVVTEYLVDLDPAKTAARCGFSLKDTKRLLNQRDVKAALARAQAARLERVGVEAETVLRELLLISTSSVGDFKVEKDGTVSMVEGTPDVYLRAVSSIKRRFITTKGGDNVVEVEIKLWDKPSCLRTLAQHLDILRGAPPDQDDPNKPPQPKPMTRGLSDEAAEAIKQKVMGLK